MSRLLLKPEEAAEALGISRSKLYQLLAAGVIPSLRLGSIIRVPAEGLRRWVERRSQPQPPSESPLTADPERGDR